MQGRGGGAGAVIREFAGGQLRASLCGTLHGIATAAGCQLVATCDLAVAADTTRFATPGVNIGLFCSTPMVALSRAVGRKHAMEMLLTGDMIGAGEAHELGLVTWVKAAGEIDAFVDGIAARLAGGPPFALAQSKALLNDGANATLREALANEARAQPGNFATADSGEAYAAFAAKREPEFTGAWSLYDTNEE